MGFPVGCSDQIVPKVLLYLLFSLSQLHELISKALTLISPIKPSSSSSSSSSSSTTIDYHYHYCGTKLRTKSHFAVLVQEILPVSLYAGFSGSSSSEERCVICLYEIEGNEEVRRLGNCQHNFHRCCLDPWIDLDQTTCPLCRLPLVPVEHQESFDRKLREAESADDDWDLLLAQ